MTDTRTLTPDDAQLAAEYALGLLDGAERSQAAARALGDPVFAAEIARWRGRLAPMLDEVAPVAPPQATWDAVERDIATAHAPGAAANDNVADLRRRVRIWRAFSGGASAIAAALALVLLLQPPASQAPAPAPAPRTQLAPMVASLASDKGEPMLMATWDPVSERLIIAAANDMPAPSGHSHEVWLIPAGGSPMKVGMLPGSARMHMQVPDEIADQLRRGATLAVSVEPAGGSPTGLPTGPVIASGALETS
jgi:anti-sigma-K factor RskA